MQRRKFLIQLASVTGALLVAGPYIWAHTVKHNLNLTALKKSDKEWRELVSRQEFHILFEEGTEPSGSSPLNSIKGKGTFICAACYLPLFESETKYESYTGWPSFYQPIAGRVDTSIDFKLIWPRKEYHCVRCGGHQGHIFDDGPPPTGLRYCNNGLALNFISDDEILPDLRS